jgi:hypothetical protein
MYDDDLCKCLNLMYDAKENDDFKNAKTFKIYEDRQILETSYILVVLYRV